MTSTNEASASTYEAKEAFYQMAMRAIGVASRVSEESRKELTSAALDVAMNAVQNPLMPISKDLLWDVYCMANDHRISSEQRESVIQVTVRYLLDKSKVWDAPLSYRAEDKIDDTLNRVNRHFKGYATIEQLACFNKVATKLISGVRQFPFMRLPPEIRNRVYELCIPSGNEYPLPSPVRCYTRHYSRSYEPAISKTCREVRCETLPIYYNCNTFNFHALRYNFDGLRAHCERIRVWNVKKVAQINLHICEMEIAKCRFTIRCAEGLWSLFHFLALTDMEINFHGGKDSMVAPVSGVVSLAAECKETKTLSKDELNATFDHWLQILGLNCWCGASEYHEFGQWFSCSRSTPASQDVRVCGRVQDNE
ncbi:hypothetical protein LTR56_003485 [Elasticomyces elasticus]|nr:hypothetical protein LTR22_010961 [Elasticomyces elasticus]KAK3655478.1 hypothetical protein LTR56_003485 [Elasticomyces elasticus]KAK4919885.1 hypothetical protein LTR49_012482 [Elasticomyces elasticus]KAK5756733.1 hypothetical protein LTS12_013197 [Elasticomyces elasticus]